MINTNWSSLWNFIQKKKMIMSVKYGNKAHFLWSKREEGKKKKRKKKKRNSLDQGIEISEKKKIYIYIYS